MFKKLNLFSKTEMKALDFISKAGGELYEREIATSAKISAGSANSILNRFAKAGLVSKITKGKMSFYSPSQKNPLLRQFKVFSTINRLLPLIEKLSKFSSRILLYGSCARGTNTQKSDTDIFILSSQRDKLKRILDDFPNIQPIILDSAEWAALSKNDKPLYDRINSGITLWEDEMYG